MQKCLVHQLRRGDSCSVCPRRELSDFKTNNPLFFYPTNVEAKSVHCLFSFTYFFCQKYKRKFAVKPGHIILSDASLLLMDLAGNPALWNYSRSSHSYEAIFITHTPSQCLLLVFFWCSRGSHGSDVSMLPMVPAVPMFLMVLMVPEVPMVPMVPMFPMVLMFPFVPMVPEVPIFPMVPSSRGSEGTRGSDVFHGSDVSHGSEFQRFRWFPRFRCFS